MSGRVGLIFLALCLTSCPGFILPGGHKAAVLKKHNMPVVRSTPETGRIPATRAVARVAVPTQMLMPAAYNGCLAVMGGWLGIFYLNLFLLLGEQPDACAGQSTFCARCLGNQGEQAPFFLTAFWMHALFASPLVAQQLGAAYLVFLGLYTAFRLYLKGGMAPWVALGSTLPRYAINTFLITSAVAQRCFGLTFGTNPLTALAFLPVCVVSFAISGKANKMLTPWFTSA
eukprot:CAMPEP_0119063120 /NCGR_PEP_ID=MMETSP1178-20130426/6536_1 /TAXON_ID=33656 /ORGANISM="unid sp, Strain CCMP2000" /LENGTH=228 /DNA_ID=CAMNT_0007044455 /DNA_START=31 /DNA_END=717 /DNA_ORIENTATION=+